jgi:hypothetical protein
MEQIRKVTRLNLAEQIRVKDFLFDKIESQVDGYVTYKDNWNDAVVAETLSSVFPCTAVNVATVRKQMYGEIRKPPSEDQLIIDELKKEIESLRNDDEITKALVHEYEAKLAALQESQTKIAGDARRHHTMLLKITDFIYNKYKVRITP